MDDQDRRARVRALRAGTTRSPCSRRPLTVPPSGPAGHHRLGARRLVMQGETGRATIALVGPVPHHLRQSVSGSGLGPINVSPRHRTGWGLGGGVARSTGRIAFEAGEQVEHVRRLEDPVALAADVALAEDAAPGEHIDGVGRACLRASDEDAGRLDGDDGRAGQHLEKQFAAGVRPHPTKLTKADRPRRRSPLIPSNRAASVIATVTPCRPYYHLCCNRNLAGSGRTAPAAALLPSGGRPERLPRARYRVNT